jgi:hypothetical protein
MKKLGIFVMAAGAIVNMFIPGPWKEVGFIAGGAIGGVGALRNAEEAFDKKVRGG